MESTETMEQMAAQEPTGALALRDRKDPQILRTEESLALAVAERTPVVLAGAVDTVIKTEQTVWRRYRDCSVESEEHGGAMAETVATGITEQTVLLAQTEMVPHFPLSSMEYLLLAQVQMEFWAKQEKREVAVVEVADNPVYFVPQVAVRVVAAVELVVFQASQA